MSTTEEHDHSTVGSASAQMEISIAELGMAIWNRRRWLTMIISLGVLSAIGVALFTPNKYTSTAELMPPDSQALGNSSMLSALAGTGSLVPSLTGGLNGRTPGETFIGILRSQTAQDDIINHFDLRRVYRCKLYIDARAILKARTSTEEDKKNGIITLSVMDIDPKRARDIAVAYIEELDKLVNKGSTSSARRERIFLEERLKGVKSDLDTSALALSNFSSRNATFNPEKQGEATVEAAGKLQGELIAAQSELSGLKAQYADDNVRVRAVRARTDELHRQLREMGGVVGDINSPTISSDQFLPSVRKLPLLGLTYSDLARRVAMQESIYETLSKQYELAKVQEAKEIPPVKVLDEPDVPERKSSPHRMTIVLIGFLLSTLAGTTWILASAIWSRMKGFYSLKAVEISLSLLSKNSKADAPN